MESVINGIEKDTRNDFLIVFAGLVKTKKGIGIDKMLFPYKILYYRSRRRELF